MYLEVDGEAREAQVSDIGEEGQEATHGLDEQKLRCFPIISIPPVLV
jgi:hypothetical protein